jgi:hypothetical protein
MNRGLIIVGLILVGIGLLWPWLSKLPFGRLPGDIAVQRDGFSFYFPLMTSLVISVLLSILLWWFSRGD